MGRGGGRGRGEWGGGLVGMEGLTYIECIDHLFCYCDLYRDIDDGGDVG